MALTMTIGDFKQFQLAVTKAGVPVNLTGIQSLVFTLQTNAGDIMAQWGIGAGVEVTDEVNGLAVLSVTPTMLAWASEFMTLNYYWSLVDFFGNPTLALELSTFQLTLPP